MRKPILILTKGKRVFTNSYKTSNDIPDNAIIFSGISHNGVDDIFFGKNISSQTKDIVRKQIKVKDNGVS